MTPAALVRDAMSKPLSDKNGEAHTLELLPPLSLSELDLFDRRLPCSLPADVRELLLDARPLAGDPGVGPTWKDR
jgi:hypothetical protein